MRETSNITKKGAAVALAAVTAMSLSVPATALAADGEGLVDTGSGTTTTTTTTTTKDVTGVLTGETSGSTTVSTAYTSEYTVTVPESVAMGSDRNATQTASVSVKGKIAAGKQVNVVPAKSITMKSTAGNETYDLTVEAGTTAWSQSDVTTAGTAKDNATISAGDAWLPGTFSGSLTYTISLGEEEAATPTTYTAVLLNTTTNKTNTYELTLGDGVDTSKTFAEAGPVPVTMKFNGQDVASYFIVQGDYVALSLGDSTYQKAADSFIASQDVTEMYASDAVAYEIKATDTIKSLPATFYSYTPKSDPVTETETMQ